ncbi:MAG: hypothetical protein ACKO5Q_22015 [Microcystaceae cyanobacterium]
MATIIDELGIVDYLNE